MISCSVKKLYSDSQIPVRKSKGAAGYDLYAYCKENIIIKKNEVRFIPTGLCFEIPDGYYLEIRSRSSIASKGIIIPNSPGTIDSDYRGEIFVPMLNLSDDNFLVSHKMRFSQMLVQKSYFFDFCEVENFKDDTIRDKGGFGSTGLYN